MTANNFRRDWSNTINVEKSNAWLKKQAHMMFSVRCGTTMQRNEDRDNSIFDESDGPRNSPSTAVNH